MVHFSMFFRYMEESEHAFWRAAGLDIWNTGDDLTWPRISANFDFKAPLRFQDEFDVHTEMGVVTRSTIQWKHTLMRGATVIGSGSVTAVCVKKSADGSMRSAEIPADVISRLRQGRGA